MPNKVFKNEECIFQINTQKKKKILSLNWQQENQREYFVHR